MAGNDLLRHWNVTVRPDPSRTVIHPFDPGYPTPFDKGAVSRAQAIVDRVLALSSDDVADEEERITAAMGEHALDVDRLLTRRFNEIAPRLTLPKRVPGKQKRLIGAYFLEEYAYEAAALFNPSAVLHPNQRGTGKNGVRFLISLRGIGEGHVSSVAFRTGIWTPGKSIEIVPVQPVSLSPQIVGAPITGESTQVDLKWDGGRHLSQTVIFPVLPSQRQGIEDLRLTRFIEDDGEVHFFGTYTAFSGASARSELLMVDRDFTSAKMRPMRGVAAGGKGMALFPRKVNGRYAMLGRQDNENVWLIHSDDLFNWECGDKLLEPKAAWEVVQIGNCGPPIELDEGWLVLTHGVGTVRNYCMGAALLDKSDPSKVLARSRRPILEPSPQERDGYVPNVVYSCGALLHGRELLIPYGVADSFTAFATVSVDRLLAALD